EEFQLPRIVVINRLDKDTASFERSLESVQQILGRMCVPIQVPTGVEKNFKGVIDLVNNKAYTFAGDGTAKFTESDASGEAAERAKEYRDKLVEAIAEGDETLMEKFFESGTLSNDDLLAGLKKQ